MILFDDEFMLFLFCKPVFYEIHLDRVRDNHLQARTYNFFNRNPGSTNHFLLICSIAECSKIFLKYLFCVIFLRFWVVLNVIGAMVQSSFEF